MHTKMRKRILTSRLYNPQWDGFICGFVVNFLRAHYWRVQSTMDYEDCLQEAKYVFCKVKKKYGNTGSPKHFMKLFKTSWTRRFDDLATVNTKQRHVVSEHFIKNAEYDFGDECSLLAGDFDNDGMLAIMIEQAPSEVKLVLQLFLTAPVEVLDMFSAQWKKRRNRKEFGNHQLCEILGLPKNTDVVGIVTDYFSPNSRYN